MPIREWWTNGSSISDNMRDEVIASAYRERLSFHARGFDLSLFKYAVK